jgi:hypothetical protein
MHKLIRDVTVSYRLYILSRRDFLLDILIGVSGSIIAGHIVQLDNLLTSGEYSILDLFTRLGIHFSVLIYTVLNYCKRTEDYERATRGMLKRNKEISDEINKRKSTDENNDSK